MALAVLSFFLCQISVAEVSLPKLLSDGLVVQQQQAIPLWGWATQEAEVTLILDGQEVKTVTVENGRWSAQLEAMPAGGPHTITVKGDNSITIKDVLVGELWLASGQSNMELPVRRVSEYFSDEFAQQKYPMVRQFTVPKEYDFKAPHADLSGGSWRSADAQSIAEFSAAAYFFAKNLNEQLNVPIGIVLAARGGASVEGLMSAEGLQQFPQYLEQAQQYADKKFLDKLIKADQRSEQHWQQNLDERDTGLLQHWGSANINFSHWPTISVPGYWEDLGAGDIDGIIWYKKEFILSEQQAQQDALLKLGRIVDADTAYLNGIQIGEITYQYPPRRYQVKSNLLREGKNVLTVRIVNQGGKGGFVPDNPYLLQFPDSTLKLDGLWHYRIGAIADAPKPTARFNKFTAPLGYYNAMIAPLVNLNIKGVIWYQGESNVGRAEEYRRLFPALIEDWRRAWQRPDLPFVFVQLPNFLEPSSQPQDSAWAELREAQRRTARLDNTAMAVAIDAGQWNDIHPFDKKTVGERLAKAARKLVYGETELEAFGPSPISAVARDKKIVISFANIAENLYVKGQALKGFALAGANQEFFWAQAKLQNNRVILSSNQVQNPAYVRYAWADNPDTANLYNSAGLPAVPFQMPIKQVDDAGDRQPIPMFFKVLGSEPKDEN